MNLPRIIGISGKIGAGKSTAAGYFIERGYRLVKFADPLKSMLRAIGLNEDEIEGSLKETSCEKLSGATPRFAMQTLGTDWGRMIHPDFWVHLWASEAAKYQFVVADDCRFQNEAAAIRARGGAILGIKRGNNLSAQSNHPSENQDLIADISILNEGCDKSVMFSRLEAAIENLACPILAADSEK